MDWVAGQTVQLVICCREAECCPHEGAVANLLGEEGEVEATQMSGMSPTGIMAEVRSVHPVRTAGQGRGDTPQTPHFVYLARSQSPSQE